MISLGNLMIGLAVYLNRKKLTVAGADDLAVLNAIINAVGELGRSTIPLGKRGKPDLWLSVGGLTSRPEGTEDEHLSWVRHKRLRVGDKITVEVVRTERPHPHTGATVAKRKMQAVKPRRKPSRRKRKTHAGR